MSSDRLSGVPNQAPVLALSPGYDIEFVPVDPAGAPKRNGNAILTRHPILEPRKAGLEPLDD